MLQEIRICANPSSPEKEKGDFFEQLLREIMETQRYQVTQNIRFTGTEIDLLCKHLDRPNDSALVECKARGRIVAQDIKSFCFDIVTMDRADYGYFVHTTDLRGEAAGLAKELQERYAKRLIFWGPGKVIEILRHSNQIASPPNLTNLDGLTVTKELLFYTYLGPFWVTILSSGIVATHYQVSDAVSPSRPVGSDALRWVASDDELKDLDLLDQAPLRDAVRPSESLDAVAEVQEAQQWDEYLPVGAKYFVGRGDLRQELYQFVQSPVTGLSNRRVFFIEGKSGWGKSSLIAALRARSRNRRNKNVFYVLAVDSRSASKTEFVSLAMAKLVAQASTAGFVPSRFSGVNIASSFDALASPQMQEVLAWLRENDRVIAIVFDQFEDIFRKEALFRAFHKLMIDVHEQQGPLVVGFSWKSEISIPIDNPAYSLWQQARDIAQIFRMGEFLGTEIESVIHQLETESRRQLPSDLKRRLKESSQGFPWLTKKLSIHCYRQIKKGVTPEELVDQNLNVRDLFDDDMEALSASETRVLRLIAKRAYENDPFDVAEIDDKAKEDEINLLRNRRLIVRSASKYNVYWDIFRDYLVEEQVPTLGESFLPHQYPIPCVITVQFLLEKGPCLIEDIVRGTPPKNISLGTVLNRVRELRHLGAVTKKGDCYQLRPTIRNIDDFRSHMHDRLNAHVVVRSLRKSTAASISQDDIVRALKDNYRGFGFAEKTWQAYANFLVQWFHYANIDFAHRLEKSARSQDPYSHAAQRAKTYTPQRVPEYDIRVFLSFRGKPNSFQFARNTYKELYDLKALGLLTYGGQFVYLLERGTTLLEQSDSQMRHNIAEFALELQKTCSAYQALRNSLTGGPSLDEALAPILDSIASKSYRQTTATVLRAWARFMYNELDGKPN